MRLQTLVPGLFLLPAALVAGAALAFPGRSAEPGPRPVIIANTLGMKFALVQAGEFQMGSPATDLDAQKCEMPPHKVRIGRHYFLGVHPVTVGQFKAFVADTGYQTEAETSGHMASMPPRATSASGPRTPGEIPASRRPTSIPW